MSTEIIVPIDASQDRVDYLNSIRYVKATPEQVANMGRFPLGLPRTLSPGMQLVCRMTGRAFRIKSLAHKARSFKLVGTGRGRTEHAPEAPWKLVDEDTEEEEVVIWGGRPNLAAVFEAPEIASCPLLWLGHGV